MFTYSKTKCIITLNLCLLRRYIADILHRGLVTTQAICYFHNNRSRGNIFTLANKTYTQYDKICFKLDYRFRLCFAFSISVYKSLYLFLSLWLRRAHTYPLSRGTCRAGRSYMYENPKVRRKNTVPHPGTTPRFTSVLSHQDGTVELSH